MPHVSRGDREPRPTLAGLRRAGRARPGGRRLSIVTSSTIGDRDDREPDRPARDRRSPRGRSPVTLPRICISPTIALASPTWRLGDEVRDVALERTAGDVRAEREERRRTRAIASTSSRVAIPIRNTTSSSDADDDVRLAPAPAADGVVADRADGRLDGDRETANGIDDQERDPADLGAGVAKPSNLSRFWTEQRRPPRRSRSGRASTARSGRVADVGKRGRRAAARTAAARRRAGRDGVTFVPSLSPERAPPATSLRRAAWRRSCRPRRTDPVVRRRSALPPASSGTAIAGPDEAAIRGAGRGELEQRAVDRVEGRRDDPDPPEPEA